MYVIEMAGYCWVCCDNERLDHILSLLRRAFTTVPNPETKVPESIVEINDKSRTTFFARALKIGDVPSDGLYICLRKKKNVPGEHIEFKHI